MIASLSSQDVVEDAAEGWPRGGASNVIVEDAAEGWPMVVGLYSKLPLMIFTRKYELSRIVILYLKKQLLLFIIVV
jgi:hypothetical protein